MYSKFIACLTLLLNTQLHAAEQLRPYRATREYQEIIAEIDRAQYPPTPELTQKIDAYTQKRNQRRIEQEQPLQNKLLQIKQLKIKNMLEDQREQQDFKALTTRTEYNAETVLGLLFLIAPLQTVGYAPTQEVPKLESPLKPIDPYVAHKPCNKYPNKWQHFNKSLKGASRARNGVSIRR